MPIIQNISSKNHPRFTNTFHSIISNCQYTSTIKYQFQSQFPIIANMIEQQIQEQIETNTRFSQYDRDSSIQFSDNSDDDINGEILKRDQNIIKKYVPSSINTDSIQLITHILHQVQIELKSKFNKYVVEQKTISNKFWTLLEQKWNQTTQPLSMQQLKNKLKCDLLYIVHRENNKNANK